MNSPLISLLSEYNEERPITFNQDQFSYILNLFPSLMICMSDGVLNPEEWHAIESTTRGLMDEFGDGMSTQEKELMSHNLLEEFRFLIEHIETWQEKFLDALKLRLTAHQEDKEFVRESMYLFANVSEGISPIERETINDLSLKLGLDN